MAFRSFAHWTGSSTTTSSARRVVSRLCCIGPLTAADVDDLRRMADLRELTLEGIETFPRALCDLSQLRSLTINRRGEDGVAELPSDIDKLASLRTLRIRAHRLTEMHESIADLEALVELDL